MNNQEEFEKWWQSTPMFNDGYFPSYRDIAKDSWKACSEQKNVIIEKQAKDLEALRGFVEFMLKLGEINTVSGRSIFNKLMDFKLADENGNQTKLLTGEK